MLRKDFHVFKTQLWSWSAGTKLTPFFFYYIRSWSWMKFWKLFKGSKRTHLGPPNTKEPNISRGDFWNFDRFPYFLRDLNPGPLAPEAKLLPLDHEDLKLTGKKVSRFKVLAKRIYWIFVSENYFSTSRGVLGPNPSEDMV